MRIKESKNWNSANVMDAFLLLLTYDSYLKHIPMNGFNE